MQEPNIKEKLDMVENDDNCVPTYDQMLNEVVYPYVYFTKNKEAIAADSVSFTRSNNKFIQSCMPWVICKRLYMTSDQEKTMRILCVSLLLNWVDMIEQLKRTLKNLHISKSDIKLVTDSWRRHGNELMSNLKKAKAEATANLDAKIREHQRKESLEEKVEKHDELNPKLWNEDKTLKPEVAEKINDIVDDFLEGLAENEIKINVTDIKLVGSNCSYNYNDKSDLDIHIIADTDSLECPDNLYPLLYSAYRSIWNKNHDVEFYGIPVEIFVETSDTQQMNEPAAEEENEEVHENMDDVKRLAQEERDAADSYERSIENADSKEEADLYKHIKSEEEEHLDELEKFENGEDVDLHEARQQTALTSNGVYSVTQSKWLKEPDADAIPDEVDQEAIDAEVAKWMERYENLISMSKPLTEEAVYGLFAIEVDGNGKKLGDANDGKPVEIGKAAELKKKIADYQDSWKVNNRGKIYDFKVRFIGNSSY